MHSDRKTTRKAKAAERAPSTTGTSKSASKAAAPIELSDEEKDAATTARPKKIHKEKAVVTEEEGEKDEDDDEGPSGKDDEELWFLMRAELERMEALHPGRRDGQGDGRQYEVCPGCMDQVEKRKRRD
ncbi:hypothetical protein P692DRAFT_20880778 [Suillus brevipes Sb2]|nr:hypothetical protein P692DRAFT_20880778 [Suillus brevipes Sb2]